MGLKEKIKYQFTEDTVSPTTIYHRPNNRAEIIICLPIQYRKKYIIGLLNHEIGTHYLRKVNNGQQVWAENRKMFKMGKFLVTEEGLAAINMFFEQAVNPPYKPYLFQPALLYFSAYLASYMSFSELFFTLRRFVSNDEKLWRQCLRVKRSKSYIIMY